MVEILKWFKPWNTYVKVTETMRETKETKEGGHRPAGEGGWPVGLVRLPRGFEYLLEGGWFRYLENRPREI